MPSGSLFLLHRDLTHERAVVPDAIEELLFSFQNFVEPPRLFLEV